MKSPDVVTVGITLGNCPDCGHRGFVIGPQGGGHINIECANLSCRERFNVLFYSGTVVFCQRIGNGREGPTWPSEPRS
jgi:hypothetical protein